MTLTAVDRVVVGVAAEGCSLEPAFGTGVAVVHGDEVLVVTSAHTVAGSDEVSLRRPSGLAVSAEVVAFDPDRDVAVIRADEMRWAADEQALNGRRDRRGVESRRRPRVPTPPSPSPSRDDRGHLIEEVVERRAFSSTV